MKRSHASLWRWTVLLAAGLLALGGCKTTPPEEGEGEEGEETTAGVTGLHADLVKLLPGAAEILNWKPAGEVQLYGPAADPDAGIPPEDRMK